MTRDPWLSQVMGHSVWSVEGPGEELAPGRAMYQARVGAERVDLARALCDEGFYPVDMALTLVRDTAPGPRPGQASPRAPRPPWSEGTAGEGWGTS